MEQIKGLCWEIVKRGIAFKKNQDQMIFKLDISHEPRVMDKCMCRWERERNLVFWPAIRMMIGRKIDKEGEVRMDLMKSVTNEMLVEAMGKFKSE